jgi:hypothetical protein
MPNASKPASHVHGIDHNQWIAKLALVQQRIKSLLMTNNVLVFSDDEINTFNTFDTFNWEPFRNSQVALLLFDDIRDEYLFECLKSISVMHGVRFTIITNIFYRGAEDGFKVLYLKEFYGVFYNPQIPTTPSYTKLYTSLMQRTTYPRLALFAELYRHKILNKGNTSLLGYNPSQKLSPQSLLISLNDEFDNVFDDVVNNIKLPYRNFLEKDNMYEHEIDGKYNIVMETYNDSLNKNWISFTEKTFRNVQIPTISLLLNKTGSVNQLVDIGIQIHPINNILDYMHSYTSQNNFIIGILCNDMFDDVFSHMAIHNQLLLKKWDDDLNSDKFYTNIIDNLL